MGFRLALVQPLAHRPPDDERNVADAVRHVEAAARAGAHVVAFPETYPGPWRMPCRFDPTEALVEAARRFGVYVQFGTLEPLEAGGRRAHNVLLLAGPSGGAPGRYRRTHPPGPWIYTGGAYWDFEYVPGDDFPVFGTEHGVFGLAMCSEVYMPEVSRALALRGAEVVFLPAGVDKLRLWASWRNLIWSRAIENLAVVVTTQNLFGVEQRGLAMLATPEEVVFESTRPGTFVLDVDLARIRDLRAQRDGVASQLENAAKAGVLSQWQRPELYDKMLRPHSPPWERERKGSEGLAVDLGVEARAACGRCLSASSASRRSTSPPTTRSWRSHPGDRAVRARGLSSGSAQTARAVDGPRGEL